MDWSCWVGCHSLCWDRCCPRTGRDMVGNSNRVSQVKKKFDVIGSRLSSTNRGWVMGNLGKPNLFNIFLVCLVKVSIDRIVGFNILEEELNA